MPQKQAKKTAPAKVKSGAENESSASRTVLARVKARLPALSSVELSAFRSLATDAQRAALGARTKARAVAGEAVRWIVQIDKDGREYPSLFDFYAKERFAYFVACALALVDQIDAEGSRRAKKGSLVQEAGSAADRAKTLRQTLVRRLEAFAGDRAKESGELSAALGSVATDDDLGMSIKGLVTLARAWMGRSDATSRVLVAAAKLSHALVDEVLAAGQALTGAAADAAEAGPAAGRDSPAVNVREGAVLREMRETMAAIGEAHQQHSAIRRLTPGAATRGVLGSRKGRAGGSGGEKGAGSDAKGDSSEGAAAGGG